jgi:hypothetical protein
MHELVARVMVKMKADLVAVERNRTIYVTYRQHDDLKGPVHRWVLSFAMRTIMSKQSFREPIDTSAGPTALRG